MLALEYPKVVRRRPAAAGCGQRQNGAAITTEETMIEGYADLRDVLVELLGGKVTGDDVDVAVDAVINTDRVTASAAISELVTLAQSSAGKAKIRDVLAKRVVHERGASADRAQHAVDAINHLLAAMDAERRTHADKTEAERRH
jgi:hypothetical protein